MDAVGAAIERSYRAFAREPRPKSMEASPVTDESRLIAILISVPLRQLSGEQIGPYAGSAILTIGSERDYRYFLPRILELAVSDPTWVGLEPAIVAHRLEYAGWDSWPGEQKDSVSNLFEEALTAAIDAEPDSPLNAESWLRGLAALGIAPDRHLALWRNAISPFAAIRLAEMVAMSGRCLRGDQAHVGYWVYVDAPLRARIAGWLFDEATRARLEAALDAVPSDERWQIEHALAIMDADA